MPIVEVWALVRERPGVAALLTATAWAAAEAFATDVRHCRVTYRELLAGANYEGGRVRAAEEAAEAALLVTVIAAPG